VQMPVASTPDVRNQIIATMGSEGRESAAMMMTNILLAASTPKLRSRL
jgi:hypothetical protein